MKYKALLGTVFRDKLYIQCLKNILFMFRGLIVRRVKS